MKNLFLLMAAFLVAEGAYAAGFEKSVMWSGKYAGVAGAAVSSVTGGQSLFFNPAGLAGPGDISLNYSPTYIKTEGNLASATTKEESKVGPLPFGGAVASYSFGNGPTRFGFGGGYYVVGGEKAYYGSVDLSGDSSATKALRPTLITDLEITEYSLGGAVALEGGFRFGANWRIVRAEGELSTIKKTIANTAYSFLYVKNLKQTLYDGWRIGMQYERPDGSWGVGATYRSSLSFNPAGDAAGTTTVIPTQGTTAQTFDDKVNVGVVFPDAFSVGGNCKLTEQLRLFTGVDLVKYSKATAIKIKGVANGTTLPDIPLEWKDMWNIRLGLEYGASSELRLRGGYSITTQTTSSSHAKATLPPPGTGHLLAVGAGYSILKNLDLDGAFEHSWNTGTGSMSMPTGTTKELLAGVSTETKAKVYAVHTGLTYKF